MVARSAIGPYRLEETLFNSKDIAVYRGARDGIEGFTKTVVVWRIDEACEAPGSIIARARCCAALSHSNVAQVLDAGTDAGGSYVVTEYVEGKSLHGVAAVVATPWPVVLELGAQVANALDHAHTRRDGEGRLLRIVHGSVGAHRILLSSSGDVKLTGFGTPGPNHTPELDASQGDGAALAVRPQDGRRDVRDLAATLEPLMPEDTPEAVLAALRAARRELPEERPRAAALRHAFRRILHDHRVRVSSTTIAHLVAEANQSQPAPEKTVPAADWSAEPQRSLEELERYARAMNPFADVDHALAVYETLGRRLVEARAGGRGLPLVIAGLDLAESLGRDGQSARLCGFLSELSAQAGRLVESLEWRARARWSEAS
ncbi:MAG: protein kinase [Myxococcota bacterium]